MIINGKALLAAAPIKNMVDRKVNHHGVSYGLSEVGYDLRVKQKIIFYPPDPMILFSPASGQLSNNELQKAISGYTEVHHDNGVIKTKLGRTALASSTEEFQIPPYLWGELRNKSTWARRFVDAALGTDMEPNWNGFLTIEIVFNGNEPVIIEAGSGLLKAVFHELLEEAEYTGKYQSQPDRPVEAILIKGN